VQAHQVSDQLNTACAKTGMSLALARALQFISGSAGPVTPSELAEELGRSPAATSSLIRRLLTDESVLVDVDPNDRRSFRITLTEHGLSEWGKVEPVLCGVEEKVKGDYGIGRLKSLVSELGDLKMSVRTHVG